MMRSRRWQEAAALRVRQDCSRSLGGHVAVPGAERVGCFCDSAGEDGAVLPRTELEVGDVIPGNAERASAAVRCRPWVSARTRACSSRSATRPPHVGRSGEDLPMLDFGRDRPGLHDSSGPARCRARMRSVTIKAASSALRVVMSIVHTGQPASASRAAVSV